MLETIAIILVVLWIPGLVSSYTMGGFIHAILVMRLWWFWFVSFKADARKAPWRDRKMSQQSSGGYACNLKEGG
jgi:hypothetical protein